MLTSVLRKIASLLFTVPALGLGVLLWGSAGEGDVSNQMHRVLPLIVLGIGSGLCLLYGRVRVLFQLLLLYASLVLLQVPVAHFQRTGMLLPATQVIFHSISLWLPLLFAGMAFWPERGRPRRDIGLRCLVLACVLLPFSLLAQQNPEGMQRMISDVHWPALQTDISALAQLPGWLFLLLGAALAWRAHRRRRPCDIAALLALLCMYVMLPRIFMTPAVLVTTPLVAMALLICAVVQEAFDLAFRDDLTGLPGRRALNEALKRVGSQYTIAMVDVDHFKKFNDTHGHDAGDEVLKLVASRLARVGGGGRAFRYGGEEFTLLFDGRDARTAREAIEDVRMAIEQARMQLRNRSERGRDDAQGSQRRGQGGNGPVVHVTASMGVADQRAGSSPHAVIKAADKALYAAKDAGRNCVRLHGQRTMAEIVGGKKLAVD
ncbi:diguanylate cyclase [Stenotrophomonas ginsengisoli]|uniref:diguanylate cyclase n=1 Tax=Stenotrophomonas ginsengisoli TaxID=336566 RepID=A0A0R0DDA2_9GAMM|nr:diguanylate cyclase [Stenotrophomonas ginsengisoli]